MAFCRGRLMFNDALNDDLNLASPNSRDKVDTNSESEGEPDHTPTKRHIYLDSEGNEPIPFDLELSVTPSAFQKIVNASDSGIASPTPGVSLRSALDSPASKYSCSPVRLTYDDSADEENMNTQSPVRSRPKPRFCNVIEEERLCVSPLTPPSKKFRSLCLYDTPHTPKSLLEKAHRRIARTASRTAARSSTGSNKSLLDPEGPQANVNPFTPTDSPNLNTSTDSTKSRLSGKGVKRIRNISDDYLSELMDEDVDAPVNKKIALREINTSRYNEEFHEVEKLGDGEFGSVFKCYHRLDGCPYAIKKSKMPVAGSAYERSAMNEVYAHAVLGKHQHVVRYYSAWAENDHMYIQNEFCNGSSLADDLAERREQKRHMGETELKLLLLQGADGLKYIHSQNLVHLDIKPGNIFLHKSCGVGVESGIEEDLLEEADLPEPTCYKIGDLGHVTSVHSPQVEEGDVRYLPAEILREDLANLTKADIFSLALTVYEAGSRDCELPKNGPAWQTIRRGDLARLPGMSDEFHRLLVSMVNPDPTARPSAAELLHHPTLRPLANVSKASLKKQLNEQRFKNQMLARELEELKQQKDDKKRVLGGGGGSNAQTMAPPDTSLDPLQQRNSGRLIGNNGKKVNRSLSVTCF